MHGLGDLTVKQQSTLEYFLLSVHRYAGERCVGKSDGRVDS